MCFDHCCYVLCTWCCRSNVSCFQRCSSMFLMTGYLINCYLSIISNQSDRPPLTQTCHSVDTFFFRSFSVNLRDACPWKSHTEKNNPLYLLDFIVYIGPTWLECGTLTQFPYLSQWIITCWVKIFQSCSGNENNQVDITYFF